MGFNMKRFFKNKDPAQKAIVKEISADEVTKQTVETTVTEIYLRELAFWSCVSKIANALTKCEFRTFFQGAEQFGEEYYLWNYEPNRNQNKAQFISKAIEKLFRTNELLIIESNDGQLLIADSFSKEKNTLYGNTFIGVSADDYQFQRRFRYDEVMYWELNNKNVNQIINRIYDAYSKVIDYTAKSYLKSRGNRGILSISSLAQADQNFDEKLKKMLNEYFKTFFENNNAVLPLFEGYKYDDLGSKTYSEGSSRDLKAQYDDIFDFTARGFSMPPSLVKGDVQDTSKAVDEMLTFCLDPLAEMLQQEANRKRNRKDVLNGTKLVIDTKKVKHMDIFDISAPADKLIGSGIATINMLLRAIGEAEIQEEWANRHMMTKNYAGIEEVLQQLDGEKGDEIDG